VNESVPFIPRMIKHGMAFYQVLIGDCLFKNATLFDVSKRKKILPDMVRCH
jgi:hypothetical protein